MEQVPANQFTPNSSLEAPTDPLLAPPKPQKSPLLMLTSIFLLLISLSTAAYLYMQNRQLSSQLTSVAPSASPTTSADPIEDWQTYTNQTPIYSFKYPSQLADLPTSIRISESNPNVVWLAVPEADTFYFEVTFLPNTTTSTWYKKAYESTQQSQVNLPTLKPGPTIDGLTSQKQTFNIEVIGERDFIFVEKGKDLYQFMLPPANNDIENQILSTFKFTN